MLAENVNLRLDAEGITLIKSYEGLGHNRKGDRYFPYLCESHRLTVGYGHVIRPGENFALGITEDDADALLAKDMVRYEFDVKNNCKIPLAQHQFNPLVSLDYNSGEAPLFGTLGKMLNAGDLKGTAAHFLDWIMAGPPGQLHVSEGLVRRRLCEANLLLHGQLELVLDIKTEQRILSKLIAEGVLNRNGRYNQITRSPIVPLRALAQLPENYQTA